MPRAGRLRLGHWRLAGQGRLPQLGSVVSRDGRVAPRRKVVLAVHAVDVPSAVLLDVGAAPAVLREESFADRVELLERFGRGGRRSSVDGGPGRSVRSWSLDRRKTLACSGGPRGCGLLLLLLLRRLNGCDGLRVAAQRGGGWGRTRILGRGIAACTLVYLKLINIKYKEHLKGL